MMVRVKRYARRYGRSELLRLRIIGMFLLAVWIVWRWHRNQEPTLDRPFQCEDITLPSISKKQLCKISLKPTDNKLPEDLCEAYPNLSILFASNNVFTEVPQVLADCPKLQMVSFKSNQISRIPDTALRPHLRWLILTDNRLSQLPQSIGSAHSLQKLMLSGNRLTELPPSLGRCTQLELIRLASNQLTAPPWEVLQLPRLAWIALSGNPFLQGVADQIPSTLNVLDDPLLDTAGVVLGEGTSGITRKVEWQGTPVAVKSYKSQTITSDGSPLEERHINVVIASIDHDALIKVFGQTRNGSLVMEFLQGYRPFGQPPSFDSCTRDVYPDHQDLGPAPARRMVTGLLGALRALHYRGIAHGDFYGHNVLFKEDTGDVKLSDFGAAFFYDRGAPYAKHLERIELRAFGHLVEEIDTLVGRREAAAGLRKALRQLREAAFAMNTFRELEEYWATLQGGVER